MPDETIHDEIESWLAADVHDQLLSEERAAFEQHLAACPACRALQQEEKNMNQLLENTLAKESADPAFEQRMVSRFRNKVPAPSGGLISFFSGLMRMRAAQITAVAALLLTLVQVGKMVTGEGGTLLRSFTCRIRMLRGPGHENGVIDRQCTPRPSPGPDTDWTRRWRQKVKRQMRSPSAHRRR